MSSTFPRPDFPPRPPWDAPEGRLLRPFAFGPFQLHRLVRESAMSRLYEGIRIEGGERVAVKLCLPAADRQRFLREIELTRSIRIPGVIKIAGDADVGETADGCPFYATAWIEGPTLGEFLLDPAVTPRRRLDVFEHLCEIVAKLHGNDWHGRPLIHRDLKPSNLKVASGPDGERPVILDWGLACAEGGHDLTVSGGHPGGTPGYCPPWSYKDPRLVRTHGRKWDVYSLAVILVEVLTGQRPEVDGHDAADERFTPPGVRELLRWHQPNDRRFDNLLARCLAEDPKQCPASAEEFLNDFRRCRRPGQTSPPPGPGRRALRLAAWAVSALVLLYLGSVLLRELAPALSRLMAERPQSPANPPAETAPAPPPLISRTNFVLRVAVAPAGATVRVVNRRANGKVVTNLTAGPEGPLEIPLPDDADARYSLEVFHPGHHSVTRPVDPEESLVTIRLEPLRGEVELVSTPGAMLDLRHAAGAARTAGPVPADGRLRVQSLDEGDWDWQLTLADHAPATGRIVRLQHGRPVRLERPLAPLPGQLSVRGPDDLEVWQAGTRLVMTNGWFILPAGEYVLELRRPGFHPEALHITLPPNGTISLVAPPFTSVSGPQWPVPALDAAGGTNSLGMRFLPVPGTDVLFSVWETRVQDYEAFVQATRHDATAGMLSQRQGGSRQRGDSWKSPGFSQGPTHPVVAVSWEDAVAFCRWLTEKERDAGILPAGWEYRLPTDAEWSAAVGTAAYPWGDAWPPPKDADNYAGEEVKERNWLDNNFTPIPNWRDEHPRTAPVGSFTRNAVGLYDLGGNVQEWCADWYRKDMNTEEVRKLVPAFALDRDQNETARVLRGASWSDSYYIYLASRYRGHGPPDFRRSNVGFRVVVGSPVR